MVEVKGYIRDVCLSCGGEIVELTDDTLDGLAACRVCMVLLAESERIKAVYVDEAGEPFRLEIPDALLLKPVRKQVRAVSVESARALEKKLHDRFCRTSEELIKAANGIASVPEDQVTNTLPESYDLAESALEYATAYYSKLAGKPMLRLSCENCARVIAIVAAGTYVECKCGYGCEAVLVEESAVVQ